MGMKYTSAYISSNGQPANGVQHHTSKRAAIAAARANRACLTLRSGGRAWAEDEGGSILWAWIEHAEGGYRVAL